MTATRPRYADTSVCPDCRSTLPDRAVPLPDVRAAAAGLPRHPAAQHAARGRRPARPAARLRRGRPRRTRRTRSPAPAPRIDPDLPPMPVARPAPVRRGLQGASVPKILLGLGATCLLVAAVIFLAVAWTWLGVGGRTAVLVALTVATGAAGTVLGRRGLTVAAEALTTVAFGLAGARRRRCRQRRLVRRPHPRGAAPPGRPRRSWSRASSCRSSRSARPGSWSRSSSHPPGSPWSWRPSTGRRTPSPPSTWSGSSPCSPSPACAPLGRRFGADVLAWVAGVMAAAAWAGSGLWALAEATAHPTARELWVDGHGWELVLVSGLSLLLWTVAWSEPLVRQGCRGAGREHGHVRRRAPRSRRHARPRLTVIAIGVTVVWSLVAAVTPPAWYAVPRVPLLAGALAVLMSALALLAYAARRRRVGGRAVDRVRRGAPDPGRPAAAPAAAPRLRRHPRLRRPGRRASAPAARSRWPAEPSALAALATLGLYPVPLWLVLAVLAAIAVGLLALALRRTDDRGVAAGRAGRRDRGRASCVAALPSLVLTTVALSLRRHRAGDDPRARPVPARRRGRRARSSRSRSVPSSGRVGELAEVDPALPGRADFVVLGLLALVLARPEVEVAAATASFVAAVVADPARRRRLGLPRDPPDPGRRDRHDERDPPRRPAACSPGPAVRCSRPRPGCGSPTSASSTRSPTRCRRRSPSSWSGSTASARADDVPDRPDARPRPRARHRPVAALGPGRPGDASGRPCSASRAWCSCWSACSCAGTLRWSSAPWSAAWSCSASWRRTRSQTPQWMLIGAAGTVLIACGITWESRMRDLQQAAAYLGRLR